MKWFNTVLSASGAAGSASAFNCTPAAFAAVLPANVTVFSAIALTDNSTYKVPPSDSGYPSSPSGLPALCAVEIHVPAPGNTTFGFGLFLPEKWNGRFLANGNGGFSGGIDWSTMGSGVGYGFASMSTDTGHLSASGNGSWAYQAPEVLNNWGYRAMHGSVVLAKQIVSAYYSKPSAYNYYNGCSTGGRQGLKEAEMFPEDFDGIVAGAPAWWTNHLQTWTVKVGTYNLPAGAPHYIPPPLFDVIAAEVLKQCDPQDGVTDQVIQDPSRCKFRPETLLCAANVTNGTASKCLTTPQINTLNLLHSDWVEANQTFLFPHLEIGSEAQWNVLVQGSQPSPLGSAYVQDFLGFGPSWNYTQFNPSVVTLADKLNPGNATVTNFDFTPFYKKGGKLLHYHGLSDGLIPTGSSVYLYEHIYRAMKPTIDVDSFYRFYLVPGMQHCAGSPAAWNAPTSFGPGYGNSGPSGVLGDAKHNVLLAIMAWVENGTAPNEIVATKFKDQFAQDTVVRQRPLCRYPLQAKYNGTGDVNLAESWSCKTLY